MTAPKGSEGLVETEHRLSRFVEGETARTIYKLPQNGRMDPLRNDVASALHALSSLEKERDEARKLMTQYAREAGEAISLAKQVRQK